MQDFLPALSAYDQSDAGEVALDPLGLHSIFDALVCCWVAIRSLQDGCRVYVDNTAAIWTPV